MRGGQGSQPWPLRAWRHDVSKVITSSTIFFGVAQANSATDAAPITPLQHNNGLTFMVQASHKRYIAHRLTAGPHVAREKAVLIFYVAQNCPDRLLLP